MKVYGYCGMRSKAPRSGQTREIVLVKSKTAAARAFGCSVYHATGFVCETRNTEELSVAVEPGVVFWRPLDHYGGEGWHREEPR